MTKMPPPALNVKLQLSTIIKKFKFEELESIVFPQFPETSWNEVRYKLVENHEAFTTKNALKIIDRVIKEKKISETLLLNRLALLEVIEVSRHSKRKTWYGYQLLKQNEKISPVLTIQGMYNSIIKNFNKLQLSMDIKLVSHDGITYVSIKEKRESRRILPVFIALFLDQGYFFCAKRNVTKDILHVVTKSFCFSNYKKLPLLGRDIKSLMKMLQLKNDGITKNNAPQFQEAKAVVKDTGLDFRQHKQRKEHLEQCFGSEIPIIDSLVVNKQNSQWADNDILEKLSDVELNMQWEFKSQNVPRFLIKLAEKRVITNPPPAYITNFLNSGQNRLNFENNDSHR